MLAASAAEPLRLRTESAAALSAHSSRRGPIAGPAKSMVATPGLIMAPMGCVDTVESVELGTATGF